MGGKSSSSTASTTNYSTDSRSYGADDGGSVLAAGGDVTINDIDAETVAQAFDAGQMMFDRALDSVDVLTDAYGQTMAQREESAGDSVRIANESAMDAISAAQPESEKTIMYLAAAGVAGLALVAFVARGR